MRNIYIFLMMACMSVMDLSAQTVDNTFRFCDKDGNLLPDGAVVNILISEEDDFGDVFLSTGLYVKNTTDEVQAGMLVENISELPNGKFQTCAFGGCIPATDGKELNSATGDLKPGAIHNIATEWFPEGYAKKPWTAVLQVKVVERKIEQTKFGEKVTYKGIKANGPKINVVFSYMDPTNIKSRQTTEKPTIKAIYTIEGKRISKPVKGINIIKLSNGEIVKQFNN